jgi:hypothetical protein
MPVTDDLVQLLDRLRTDQTLIAQFRANPGTAIQDFEITAHERDAVVTRDLDDFVALGVVASIWDLPEVLTGPRPGGPLRGILDRLKALLKGILRRRRVPQRPIPPRPRPMPDPPPGTRPRPMPDPAPGPRPRPTPGPDPPRPDL